MEKLEVRPHLLHASGPTCSFTCCFASPEISVRTLSRIVWVRSTHTNPFSGYPIEQLAEKSTHLESAYLLIYGSLPTKDQYKYFETEVLRHGILHSDAQGFFRSFRYVSCRIMIQVPLSHIRYSIGMMLIP